MLVIPFGFAVVLFGLWFVLALLQAIDLAATWGASRTSGRAAAQVWSAAAAGIVIVAGSVAAQWAAQPRVSTTSSLLGLGALLLVLALVCGCLIAIVLASQRPWVDGLTAVEAGIRSFDGVRVAKSDVAALTERVAEADRARLDHTHPRAWVALDSRGRRTCGVRRRHGRGRSGRGLAHAVVGRGTRARSDSPERSRPIRRGSVASGGTRSAETAYSARRRAIVAELDQLERRASRGVAGLTERVSRALTILREQDRRK